MLATSQRAIAAAAARVKAAAAPVVTSPASAPVASGDAPARGVLQFADIDRSARCRRHRGDHLGRHHRAPQPGERAGGVEAGTHAEACIGIGSGHRRVPQLPSLFRGDG